MPAAHDLVCFSHLRWDFVFQRPQHLLSRFARERRVFFVEEPVDGDGELRLRVEQRDAGLVVATPELPPALHRRERVAAQQQLVDRLLEEQAVERFVAWYYTPAAMEFTAHLSPLATVYDCMDELSAFADAPPELRAREEELLERSDLVFTGGQSLYDAKRDLHPAVHLFPSSVDTAHFARAREPVADPPDQAPIARPRLGFYGVLDERLDVDLVAAVADLRPDWQLVLVGPVVKIDESALPLRPNVHYLGPKPYDVLPAYVAGWDVALLPFARNAATQFISPTKTPEYLAAGRPVVSTPIRDVVRPYGDLGLVHVAGDPPAFVAAVERALGEDREERIRRADAFLADTSWDRTWAEMATLIARRLRVATS